MNKFPKFPMQELVDEGKLMSPSLIVLADKAQDFSPDGVYGLKPKPEVPVEVPVEAPAEVQPEAPPVPTPAQIHQYMLKRLQELGIKPEGSQLWSTIDPLQLIAETLDKVQALEADLSYASEIIYGMSCSYRQLRNSIGVGFGPEGVHLESLKETVVSLNATSVAAHTFSQNVRQLVAPWRKKAWLKAGKKTTLCSTMPKEVYHPEEGVTVEEVWVVKMPQSGTW